MKEDILDHWSPIFFENAFKVYSRYSRDFRRFSTIFDFLLQKFYFQLRKIEGNLKYVHFRTQKRHFISKSILILTSCVFIEKIINHKCSSGISFITSQIKSTRQLRSRFPLFVINISIITIFVYYYTIGYPYQLLNKFQKIKSVLFQQDVLSDNFYSKQMKFFSKL